MIFQEENWSLLSRILKCLLSIILQNVEEMEESFDQSDIREKYKFQIEKLVINKTDE